MKTVSQLLLTFALLCAICSCNQKKENAVADVQESSYGIETGDLLFISLPADYDLDDTTYVAKDKQKNYIHIAILENDSDSIFVIDATLKYGVHRHPLQSELDIFTLRDGSLPKMEIKRLKDNSEASAYVENSKKYLGAEYDKDFTIDNGKYYCSELVSISYIKDEKQIFPYTQLNFCVSDGTLPRYWTQLCEKVNMQLPSGEGIMPKDIYDSDLLISLPDTLAVPDCLRPAIVK